MLNPSLFAFTLSLSAALLFSLQPMVGKILLPVFGGTSSVWTTCLVVFQLVYLAGCLWVYGLTRWVPGRAQMVCHGVAILAVGFFLPPSRLLSVTALAPVDSNPLPWLMSNLLWFIGPPLFITSATSPLLQSWFSRIGHARSKDPYYLSMASNFGSLLALFCYPFLFEAHFGLTKQGAIWTFGYVLFAALVFACALIAGKVNEAVAPAARDAVPLLPRRLLWVLLAFLPSSLLSGSTFFLSELVSVMPLLWIVPLILYLLSLIVAFSPHAEKFAMPIRVAAAVLAVPWFFTAGDSHYAIWLLLPLHLSAFFFASTALHGFMVSHRPSAKHLPEFYLAMAIGGAAGGAFNGLVAPVLFTRAVEYPLGIACALALFIFFWAPQGTLKKVAAGALALAAFLQLKPVDYGSSSLFLERNFYGIVRVTEDPVGNRYLFHNVYMQSKQAKNLPERNKPYANLGYDSAIGILLTDLNSQTPPNVAVIGMGAGVLAAYAKPGTWWSFYELNPSIVKVVDEQKLFTYVQESAAEKTEVILGDARRQMEKARDHFYQLVVVDAFNSTSMPAHLITKEAFELYFKKMTQGGIVALNNISRLFDLSHVACGIAQSEGWTCVTWRDQDWVFVTKQPGSLAALKSRPEYHLFDTPIAGQFWTDEYSNPHGIIQWPQLRRARQWVRRLSSAE